MYWPSEGCITMWYEKPTGDHCLCKKCCLGEQWSNDVAVSPTFARHSDIQSENTRFETLWLSPLTRMSSDVADRSLLHYCFLRLWAFCQPVLLLTYVVASMIRSYCELDPWHIIHVLGSITPKFWTISVMIMAALALFQAWICVGVGIGKFLIDLGVRNIFDTKLMWSESMLASGWLYVSLRYYKRFNSIMDWKVHIVKLELNDTWKLLLYCGWMDGNICMMNKYSELY